MTLGAGSADVLGLVLAYGMRLLAVGLGVGLIGSWVLSRVRVSQGTESTARDPLTYGSGALLLAGVALLATYVPARVATKK